MADDHAQRAFLDGCVAWPEPIARTYRQRGYWAGIALGDLLQQHAALQPSNVALMDECTSLTYKELDQLASKMAGGFLSRGLQRDDRVVIQLSNRVEWFIVCFALWRLGAIPVMAQPAHRHYEIEHFITQTKAVAYVVDDLFAGFDYRTLAKRLKEKCTTLREIFIAGDPGRFTSLSSILSKQPSRFPPVNSGDVALLQLSGGSSGAPKLIPRTHDDYLYSVRKSAEVCALNSSSIYLAALPVAHNFPLSSPGALGTLFAGGKVLLCKDASPTCAFPWIQRFKPTLTALVPSLAQLWLDAAPSRKIDLSTFRLLQVGGAKLDEHLALRLQDATHGGLQQVFGMAEGLINYTRPGDAQHLVTRTQGSPLSEADEIRIVDEDDKPVRLGKVGNLLTRGPYTIRGYYHSSIYNQSAFTRDGFYRTGDRVRQTAEGYLVVEGRAKDQINRGGEKISSQEVEIQLRKTGLIKDAALLPLPDEYLGERACACVVPRVAPIEEKSVRAALRALGLANYKIPDQFIFMDSLPKTAVGKTDKESLKPIISKNRL